MKIQIPALCAVVVLLAACTSLSTTSIDNFKVENPDTVKGLIYYLPVGRIHMVGTFGKASTTTTDPQQQPPGNGEAVLESTSATNVAPSSLAAPKTPNVTAQGGDSPFTITITADITADTEGGCFVKRDSNYIYDDTIDIKIDGATGLLSTGDATSKDETAQVVSDIASTIGMRNLMSKQPGLETKQGPYPKPFDVIFYPKGATLPNQGGGMTFEQAQTMLENCGFKLNDARVLSQENASGDAKVIPGVQSSPIHTEYHDGVAFRIPMPYPISIQSEPDKVQSMSISASRTLILPDPSHDYFLDYSRMPFVQKKTNIAFTNGMLTEYSQEVPSPIAGFLGIPKSIIQAVVPLPLGSAAPSSNSAGKSTKSSK
jgi:hypothetical protein